MIGLVLGGLMMGVAHFAGDGEVRYSAGCWSMFSWARCHQENYGDIHTAAYLKALRDGVNPHHQARAARSAVSKG